MKSEAKRGFFRRNFLSIISLLFVLSISAFIFYCYRTYPRRIEELKNYGYAGAFIVSLLFNATVILPAGNALVLATLRAVLPYSLLVGIAAGAKLALLLLVLAIPIVDVAWLMISRLRAGESIGKADRRHLHFRLLDLGLSQRQVVLLYYGYCALLGAAALLIGSRLLKLGTLVVLGIATVGILAWLARQTLRKEP